MLKKQITYADLDGNPVTEDFYFNLTKAEAVEVAVLLSDEGADKIEEEGDLEAFLKAIVEAREGKRIMRLFKEIIGMSVGRRSEDNKTFLKNEKIRDEFMCSDAYSELFMQMVTDANFAAEFMQGVAPIDIKKAVSQVGGSPVQAVPAYKMENRKPTPKELQAMSKEEILEAMKFEPTA